MSPRQRCIAHIFRLSLLQFVSALNERSQQAVFELIWKLFESHVLLSRPQAIDASTCVLAARFMRQFIIVSGLSCRQKVIDKILSLLQSSCDCEDKDYNFSCPCLRLNTLNNPLALEILIANLPLRLILQSLHTSRTRFQEMMSRCFLIVESCDAHSTAMRPSYRSLGLALVLLRSAADARAGAEAGTEGSKNCAVLVDSWIERFANNKQIATLIVRWISILGDQVKSMTTTPHLQSQSTPSATTESMAKCVRVIRGMKQLVASLRAHRVSKGVRAILLNCAVSVASVFVLVLPMVGVHAREDPSPNQCQSASISCNLALMSATAIRRVVKAALQSISLPVDSSTAEVCDPLLYLSMYLTQ